MSAVDAMRRFDCGITTKERVTPKAEDTVDALTALRSVGTGQPSFPSEQKEASSSGISHRQQTTDETALFHLHADRRLCFAVWLFFRWSRNERTSKFLRFAFFGEFENVDVSKGVHFIFPSIPPLRFRDYRYSPWFIPKTSACHLLHGKTRQCDRADPDHRVPQTIAIHRVM